MATTPSFPGTDASDVDTGDVHGSSAADAAPSRTDALPSHDAGKRSDGSVPSPPTGKGPSRGGTLTAPSRAFLFGVPRGILALGLLGTVLAAIGNLGARDLLTSDPLLSDSPLSWITYGHGKVLANVMLYLGIALLTLAWIRLGRAVRAGEVRGRAVFFATVIWMLPLLVCPPMFSNDVYSYLAQSDLPLHGMNPYHTGVSELPSVFDDNVTPVWQHTAAPYEPLFILLGEGVVKLIGYHQVLAVLVMRWVIVLPGFGLCAWALPRLARHYGGTVPVTIWLALANPLTLIYLIGGPHNDMLMAGLLIAGSVLVLERRPLWGFLLVCMAAAIKAPAALALPFLVWVWAAYLPGSAKARFAKACSAGVAIFAAVFAASTFAARVDLGWVKALSANNIVVNWMSLPSGLGQLVHVVVSIFVDVDQGPFVTVARGFGMAAIVAVAARQWWLARAGGPDALRRIGIALFVLVLLSPTSFPWYFFWPLMLCAGLTWSGTGLVVLTFLLLWNMLSTFPTGDTALYNVPYLVLATALSALAAISLVRVDPLKLSPHRREKERPGDFTLSYASSEVTAHRGRP